MMPLHKQAITETLKLVFLELGVQAITLEVTEEQVILGDRRLLGDALVGELQQAGELDDALLCATFGISLRWQNEQQGVQLEFDPDRRPTSYGLRRALNRKEPLVTFAEARFREAEAAVQTLYDRARTALTVTPKHRIRRHHLGHAYVDVAATSRRELGAWLHDLPRADRTERLKALASSPFRHLLVTVLLETQLPDGRFRRDLVHTAETHVAPDRPLPATRVLRQARSVLQAKLAEQAPTPSQR